SDLVFGKQAADLGKAGKPDGKTLADDDLTSALADCLGDVVVANLTTSYQSGLAHRPGQTQAEQAALAKLHPAGVQLGKLTEVAIGVSAPKSASDTPRAVVCTAWADQSAADGYAAAIPDVLASGMSLATNQPYAQILHNPTNKKVGGDAHI